MTSFVSQQNSSKPSSWGERWVAPQQPPSSMQDGNSCPTEQWPPANQEYCDQQHRPAPQGQNGNPHQSGQGQQYRPAPQGQNGNPHQSGQGQQYRPAPQGQGQQGSSDEAGGNGLYPRFFGIKAHGTKAAIYFTPDTTKSGYQTVAIEAAEMLIPAEKKYNWNQKTRLQLTRSEILDVIAVMLGLSPGCEFGNHKGANNAVKSFTMKHQGKSVFISVSESGRPIKAVPVPVMEAIQIGHMILTVYIQNYPGLSPDVVVPTLARAINGRAAPQQS